MTRLWNECICEVNGRTINPCDFHLRHVRAMVAAGVLTVEPSAAEGGGR